MKRVTASEARQHWFQLLDEVAQGEIVVLTRRGRRIVVRRDEPRATREARPDSGYQDVIDVPHLDQADRWGWDFDGESLRTTTRRQ